MLKLLKTLSRVGISELVDFVGGSEGDDSADGRNGSDGWFQPARVHALEDRRVLAVNLTPTVTTASTIEGTQVTLSATFTDTLTDVHRVTINWGDGSTNTTFNVSSGNEPTAGTPGSLSASHTYANNGTFTATITVTDRDPTPADADSATVTVTVADVAPTIDGTSVQLLDIDEGETALLTFDFDDAGVNDTYKIEVDWGSGTFVDMTSAGTLTTNSPGNYTFTVSSPGTFAAGTFTVRLRVTDAVVTASSDTESTSLTVNNVDPALANVTLPAINEGNDAQLDFDVVDPGSNDSYTVEVNWGSGFVDVTASGVAGAGGTTHFSLTSPAVFGQQGTQVVAIRVLDSASAVYDSASPTLTINDVAPSIGTTTLPAVNEGSSATLTVQFFDPGLSDTFKIEVNWGTGSGFVDVTSAGTLTSDGVGNHSFVVSSPVYVDSGTFTVQVRVTDAIVTTATDTESASLTVNDVAPAIDPTSIVLPAANEGQATTLSFEFFDPGLNDTYTIAVDWGTGTFVDVTSSGTLTSDGAGNHTFTVSSPTFGQNGSYTVRMRVTDAVTTTSTDTESATLTVNDVAPAIVPGSISLPAISEGGVAVLTFQFSDPGLSDTYLIEVDWGQGAGFEDVTALGTLSSLGGATRTFIVSSPVYVQDGTYTVQLRVTDAVTTTATDTESTTLTVNDVAPSLGTITLPAVNEGQLALLTFDVTDPGGDAFVVQVDWGDGNGFVTVTGTAVGGGTVHFAVTSPGPFVQNGLYTLQVRVLDTALTTVHSTASPVLTVNDVAPIIAPAAISLPAINEGQSTTLSFTYFDPGLLDTHTIEVDWGDGIFVDETSSGVLVADGFGTHLFTVNSPVYGQDGTFTVRIRVTDTVTTTATDTESKSLTVADVPPAIGAVSLPAVNEGQQATLTFDVTDPGNDLFVTQVNWGDGNGFVTVTGVSAGGGTTSFVVTSPNPFPQNGSFTVQVRVLNTTLTTIHATASPVLTVNDVAPAILPASISLPAISEGGVAVLTFQFSDPGLSDTYLIEVDWGQGAGFEDVTALGTLSSLGGATRTFIVSSPVYVQDGTYTVQMRVTDAVIPTANATESTTLTVNDVAPSLGTITLPAVNEGQLALLTFDVTDPGGDAFVVQVDWGDGNGFVTVSGTAVGGGTVHFAVTSPGPFVQNGLYTLQVRVLDTALTTVHSTASPVLTVNDVAPIIAPAAISLPAVNEGQSTTLNFTYFDPGLLDTHTIEVDWGDGAGYVDVTAAGFTVADGFGTHLFTVNSPVYGQDGTFTVRIRVTDTVTASVGTAATTLTVSDVSPVIDPLSISLPAINEGQSTTLLFTFFDPGLSDTFTVEVDWGTGGGFVTVSAANVVSNGAGNHTVTVTSPAFAQDGFFTVQMRVTDAVRPASLDTRQAILLVVDIPPAIDAGSILLPAINEGQRPTLSFDVIDPGVLDLFVVQVDWGDGNGFVTVTPSRLLGGARQFSATAPNPFVQDGSRTIQIRVLDTALTTVLATASPTLTVLDVAPAINPASVALPSITEGQSAALSFDFFDPGLSDTFQVEVDWGTGAGFANMTGAGVLTSDGAGNHTFTVTSPAFVQDGSFTVNIRLTDAVLPAAVSTAVGTLTVTNVAPQIVSVVVLPGAINEGDAVTVRVTFVDPGLADFDPAVPVTVSIDWGDHAAGVPVLDVRSVTLTRLATGQYSFDVTRVFPDDGPSTNPTDINNVTIQFADNVAVAALAPGLPAPQVTVNNLPPTVTSSLNPVLVDSIGVVTLNLEFADRGILDALVPDLANWDWGGRGVQLGPPTITTTGTGTFLLTARFQFTENPPTPGPTALNPIPHFTIQFAVVDKDGGLSIGTIDANVPSGIARFQPEAPAPAPPLNPPQSIAQTVPSAPQSSVVVTNESQAPSSSQSSVESTSAKVVLREVLPSGRERLLGSFDENSLDAVLDQLKGLPDRRYRVYMVMPDGSERLIVDVLVREGKPTDPAADSRDVSPQRQAPANSDRNLWSDSPQQAPESTETTAPGDAGDPAAGAPSDSGEDADADAAATGQSDNAGVAAEQIANQGIGVVRRSPAAERELAEPVGPRLP